jgi:hypothetical protein
LRKLSLNGRTGKRFFVANAVGTTFNLLVAGSSPVVSAVVRNVAQTGRAVNQFRQTLSPIYFSERMPDRITSETKINLVHLRAAFSKPF